MVIGRVKNALTSGYRSGKTFTQTVRGGDTVPAGRLDFAAKRAGQWLGELRGVLSGPSQILAGLVGGGAAATALTGFVGVGLTVLLYYLWSNGMIPFLG